MSGFFKELYMWRRKLAHMDNLNKSQLELLALVDRLLSLEGEIKQWADARPRPTFEHMMFFWAKDAQFTKAADTVFQAYVLYA